MEGYGMSETLSQTHFTPPDRPKLQCLGIPAFDVDARVIDPETLEELGPNQVGEIVSSGNQVMQGYWRKPEATEEVFLTLDSKRILRTGGTGMYDDEGSDPLQAPGHTGGLRDRHGGLQTWRDGQSPGDTSPGAAWQGHGAGNYRVVEGTDGCLQVPEDCAIY